jgi:hypothetical protein
LKKGDDPVEISGKIYIYIGEVIDKSGNIITSFSTKHEGRGKFEIIGKKHNEYFLKINNPSGVTYNNPLPNVLDKEGVSIMTTSDIYENDFIEFKISSNKKGVYIVNISKKNIILVTENIILDEYEIKLIKLKISDKNEDGKLKII